MVAFCAIYITQSIGRLSLEPLVLSDWDLFRIATLQELIGELESQAEARHQLSAPDSMSVVHAMARQLSRGLNVLLAAQAFSRSAGQQIAFGLDADVRPDAQSAPDLDQGIQHCFNMPISQPDAFVFSNDNAMPFISDWNIDSALPDFGFPWDTSGSDAGDINAAEPSCVNDCLGICGQRAT